MLACNYVIHLLDRTSGVRGPDTLWRVPWTPLLAVSFIHLAFGSDTVQSLILKIEHRAEGGIHDEK